MQRPTPIEIEIPTHCTFGGRRWTVGAVYDRELNQLLTLQLVLTLRLKIRVSIIITEDISVSQLAGGCSS